MAIDVSANVQYVMDTLFDENRILKINDAIFYQDMNQNEQLQKGLNQIEERLLANDYSLVQRIDRLLEVGFAWDSANQEGLLIERGFLNNLSDYEYEWYLICDDDGVYHLEQFINRVFVGRCDVDKLVYDLLEIPEGRRLLAGMYDEVFEHIQQNYTILPEHYIDEVCEIDYRERIYTFFDRYSVEDHDYMLLLINHHIDEISSIFGFDKDILQKGFDELFELFGIHLVHEQASQVLAL